jgi:predicted aspartyl protease
MEWISTMACAIFLLLPAGEHGPNPWTERLGPARERVARTGSVEAFAGALDAAWRADDWRAGLELALEAQEKHPRRAQLDGLVTRALWRAGRITQAEAVAQRISPTSDDPVALGALIGVHLARGEPEKADDIAARLERVGPRSASDFAQLVAVRLHRNRLDGLAAHIEKTQRLADPNNGYPEYFLRDSLQGVAEFYARIGTEPTSRIDKHGRAPLRVLAMINLPAVDAYLNGKGPYRLIVDTGGSTALSLDTDVAAEIGLKSLADALVHGVSGKDTSGQALLDHLRLDEIVCRRVPTRIFGVRAASAGAADGILGTGVFSDARFTMNFMEPSLHVAPSSAEPGRGKPVDLRVVGDSKLIAALELNGEPAVALFDTGADVVVVSPQRLNELHPEQSTAASVGGVGLGVGQGAATTITVAPGVTFSVAGREYRNYSGLGLNMLDDLLSPILGIRVDLLIGMPVFREMRSFTVDLPRSRMWVEWLD